MIMASERAQLLCATHDCPRDAIMKEGGKPRWCVICAPRPAPLPCDAVLYFDADPVTGRHRDAETVPVLCGDTDAIRFKPAGHDWIVRCSRHRTADRLRNDFLGKTF